MNDQPATKPEPPEVLAAIYRHFREFFDLAERRHGVDEGGRHRPLRADRAE